MKGEGRMVGGRRGTVGGKDRPKSVKVTLEERRGRERERRRGRESRFICLIYH